MLSGKGMFIWMIRHTMGGDVNLIADTLEAAGITNAWIKVADGSGRYNIDPLGVDRVPGLVAALRMRGISAWGWQYIYGRYPDYEADMAIRRIKEFDLDGFVVNAELEFKAAGMGEVATRYMRRLRNAFPDLPIGLSTYRFPTLHREFPFDAFLAFCDFSAPQVYWAGATNAGAQLERCVREYKALKYKLPIYPTGAAYKEHNWQAKASEMVEFMETAKKLGMPGFNFWEMRSCRIYIPGGWKAVHEFEMTGDGGENDGGPGTGDGGDQTGDGGPGTGISGTVLTKELNIRSGPGVRFSDVGDLVRDDMVPIMDIGGTDAWAKISENPDRWVAVETGGVRYLGVKHAGTE